MELGRGTEGTMKTIRNVHWDVGSSQLLKCFGVQNKEKCSTVLQREVFIKIQLHQTLQILYRWTKCNCVSDLCGREYDGQYDPVVLLSGFRSCYKHWLWRVEALLGPHLPQHSCKYKTWMYLLIWFWTHVVLVTIIDSSPPLVFIHKRRQLVQNNSTHLQTKIIH